MRLSSGQSHVVIILFGCIVGVIVFLFFTGEGYHTFLFWKINKVLSAKMLAVVSFGIYGRWCYEQPILPNEQGIQLFLGAQTGEVWGEGNFLFIPRPFWSIWKRVSVQHFSFTVAAQNRTKEGHLVMVFATGRAVPTDAHLLAKMSQEGIQEQVFGLSMRAIGSYIRANTRNTLLDYQSWDISKITNFVLGENKFYGLHVAVFTTKVIEISQETVRQFDTLARQVDMETTIKILKQNFSLSSDVELYAMYASLIGINPSVMSHVIHGGGSNAILLGSNKE